MLLVNIASVKLKIVNSVLSETQIQYKTKPNYYSKLTLIIIRYIINDACVLLGKPLISGSAVGFEGQVTVIAPGVGPCYR